MVISHSRLRRKVARGSHIPIYRDVKTSRPFQDDLSAYEYVKRKSSSTINGGDVERAKKTDHVYLEGIGAACSCLQATFQAKNLTEARYLYDQLIPITPIVLGKKLIMG